MGNEHWITTSKGHGGNHRTQDTEHRTYETCHRTLYLPPSIARRTKCRRANSTIEHGGGKSTKRRQRRRPSKKQRCKQRDTTTEPASRPRASAAPRRLLMMAWLPHAHAHTHTHKRKHARTPTHPRTHAPTHTHTHAIYTRKHYRARSHSVLRLGQTSVYNASVRRETRCTHVGSTRDSMHTRCVLALPAIYMLSINLSVQYAHSTQTRHKHERSEQKTHSLIHGRGVRQKKPCHWKCWDPPRQKLVIFPATSQNHRLHLAQVFSCSCSICNVCVYHIVVQR